MFVVIPAEDDGVVAVTDEYATAQVLADDGRGSADPFDSSSVAYRLYSSLNLFIVAVMRSHLHNKQKR